MGKHVRQTLALPEGKTVQLLDPIQLTGENRARNIVTVDQVGRKLWVVEADQGAKHSYSESVWVSIALNDAGELWARNFRGFEAQISIQDGRIIQKKLYR